MDSQSRYMPGYMAVLTQSMYLLYRHARILLWLAHPPGTPAARVQYPVRADLVYVL